MIEAKEAEKRGLQPLGRYVGVMAAGAVCAVPFGQVEVGGRVVGFWPLGAGTGPAGAARVLTPLP